MSPHKNRIKKMGSDISSNYDSITPIFIAGFWRVHSAIHRSTHEPTSLWVLDDQILSNNVKSRTEQDKYIQTCIYSISQIRKLHHPQILKINESNDNPKQLAFSAESVNSCLINEVNLNPDEIEYIASQLSSALFFLHHTARIAHLNIQPNSIVLSKSFSLKLCGFNFSSNITGDSQKVFPNFGEWSNSASLPNINFSAPEMVTNKMMTNSCDIFSFGCVIYSCYLKRQLFSFSTVNEMIRTLTNGMLVHPESASDQMRQILSRCISFKPENRPTIDDIDNSEALNSLQLKVYKYVDNILTKSQAEKFNFFKSLLQSLSIFSQRMLRFKFFPLLMNETLTDSRFGPVTIPLLIQIGALFDRREFLNVVYSPIQNLLTVTKPPEMTLSIFSVMRILIDRIDPERHIDLIYPIYNAAFQSNDKRLHSTAMSYLPMLIKTLHTTALKNTIIPKLIEFMKTTQDPNIASNCISTFTETLNRIDHDTLTKMISSTLTETWQRFKTDDVGTAIIGFIEKVEPEIDIKMGYLIPLIATILSSQILDPKSQIKLVKKAQDSFTQLVSVRKLDEFVHDEDQANEKVMTKPQQQKTSTVAINKNDNIKFPKKPLNVDETNQNNYQQIQIQQQQNQKLQTNLQQNQQLQTNLQQNQQQKIQKQQLNQRQHKFQKQTPDTQNTNSNKKARPVVLPKQEKVEMIPQPPATTPQPPKNVQRPKPDFFNEDEVQADDDYSDEIDQVINDAILGERDRTKSTNQTGKYIPKRSLRHYNT